MHTCIHICASINMTQLSMLSRGVGVLVREEDPQHHRLLASRPPTPPSTTLSISLSLSLPLSLYLSLSLSISLSHSLSLSLSLCLRGSL